MLYIRIGLHDFFSDIMVLILLGSNLLFLHFTFCKFNQSLHLNCRYLTVNCV